MTPGPPWQTLLHAPAPGQHIAQLYTDRRFLASAVGQFAADGLRHGEAFVAIATPLHWHAIARRLHALDVDVDNLQRRGALVVRDAAETLAVLLVGGMPDRDRFESLIGGLLAQVRAAGYARVRGFGEMVDLLRRSNVAATLHLEALWGALIADANVALLCGYSLDAFDPSIYRGLLQQVSASHSDLIPIEDYARLDEAVERAYADVFGGGDDAAALRRAFVSHYAAPASMPEAEAAILALPEFVPGATLDAVLACARRHYDLARARALRG